MTTDNLRIFLWVGLMMLVWLTVQTWQQTYSPRVGGAAQQTATTKAGPAAAAEPALPPLPGLAAAAPPTAMAPADPVAGIPPPAAATLIHVRTDVFDLAIDLKGGNIVDAKLPTYPIHKDKPGVPVELLSPVPERFFSFQGGLRAADGQPEANHLATFVAPRTEFRLEPGASELKVPLRWESPTGVVVTKTYTFRPGHFQIDLEYAVQNNGTQPYQSTAR